MASAQELGSTGAYYFTRHVDWIRRHVQHITFPDPQTARQQLTIDLILPGPDARIDHWLTWPPPFTFCMPVARLEKNWAIHELDFVDEDGHSLPLFTSAANAEISAIALTEAMVRAGINREALSIELEMIGPGGLVRRENQQIIEMLTGLDAIPATSYRELARAQVASLGNPQRDRLQHLVADLTDNAYVWLPLRGAPGQQRTIKLSYGIELPARASVQRKPGTPMVVRNESHPLPVSIVRPGDVDYCQTASSILQESAAAFGMATRVFRIPASAAHAKSYHLSFTAPEGVVVQQVSAELITDHGRRITPPVSCRGRQGTVYFSAAPLARGEATFFLRPDLHGLGLAATYALATAFLLWVVHASLPIPSTADDAVAAVLLIIPTFLVVFGRRRSEHVLAGSLLDGVRLLVLLVGAFAVAAGAAIGDVHPILSTAHTFLVAAIGATACGVLLVTAWLRWAANSAWRWGRRARQREHRPG